MSLRYVAADAPFRLPRDELPGGRQLSTGGVLSGALHTLGYVRSHTSNARTSRALRAQRCTHAHATHVHRSIQRRCASGLPVDGLT